MHAWLLVNSINSPHILFSLRGSIGDSIFNIFYYSLLVCQTKSLKIQLLILNPNQIPIIPPMAVKITDEKERKLAPQRLGTRPPTVEPTIIKNHTMRFESINFSIKLFKAKQNSPRRRAVLFLLSSLYVYRIQSFWRVFGFET